MLPQGFEGAVYVSLALFATVGGTTSIYNLHVADTSLGKYLSLATVLMGLGFAFFYTRYLGLIGKTVHQLGSSAFLLLGQALVLYVVHTVKGRVTP